MPKTINCVFLSRVQPWTRRQWRVSNLVIRLTSYLVSVRPTHFENGQFICLHTAFARAELKTPPARLLFQGGSNSRWNNRLLIYRQWHCIKCSSVYALRRVVPCVKSEWIVLLQAILAPTPPFPVCRESLAFLPHYTISLVNIELIRNANNRCSPF